MQENNAGDDARTTQETTQANNAVFAQETTQGKCNTAARAARATRAAAAAQAAQATRATAAQAAAGGKEPDCELGGAFFFAFAGGQQPKANRAQEQGKFR